MEIYIIIPKDTPIHLVNFIGEDEKDSLKCGHIRSIIRKSDLKQLNLEDEWVEIQF
jgi:hypothetical protein